MQSHIMIPQPGYLLPQQQQQQQQSLNSVPSMAGNYFPNPALIPYQSGIPAGVAGGLGYGDLNPNDLAFGCLSIQPNQMTTSIPAPSATTSTSDMPDKDYWIITDRELEKLLPDPKPTEPVEVGILANGYAYAPKTAGRENYLLFPSKSSYILYFTHHYFSRENLDRDKYFQSMLIDGTTLPLEKLIKAPRLAALGTTVEEVEQALVGSKIVRIDSFGTTTTSTGGGTGVNNVFRGVRRIDSYGPVQNTMASNSQLGSSNPMPRPNMQLPPSSTTANIRPTKLQPRYVLNPMGAAANGQGPYAAAFSYFPATPDFAAAAQQNFNLRMSHLYFPTNPMISAHTTNGTQPNSPHTANNPGPGTGHPGQPLLTPTLEPYPSPTVFPTMTALAAAASATPYFPNPIRTTYIHPQAAVAHHYPYVATTTPTTTGVPVPLPNTYSTMPHFQSQTQLTRNPILCQHNHIYAAAAAPMQTFNYGMLPNAKVVTADLRDSPGQNMNANNNKLDPATTTSTAQYHPNPYGHLGQHTPTGAPGLHLYYSTTNRPALAPTYGSAPFFVFNPAASGVLPTIPATVGTNAPMRASKNPNTTEFERPSSVGDLGEQQAGKVTCTTPTIVSSGENTNPNTPTSATSSGNDPIPVGAGTPPASQISNPANVSGSLANPSTNTTLTDAANSSKHGEIKSTAQRRTPPNSTALDNAPLCGSADDSSDDSVSSGIGEITTSTVDSEIRPASLKVE